MSDTNELLADVDGDIATLTLNRPDFRNALTFAMYHALADYCANPPEGVRAIIVRGAGEKAFAAGTDIRQFRDFNSPEDALGYEQRIDEVLDAVATCVVPTVAAISGACTGGGAMIAASCDIRICADNMRFGFPIARTLGNTLSARSLARLHTLVSPARAREMIFTSRLLDAEECLTLGIVTEMLDEADSLFGRAVHLAGLLASQAPLTLRATKTLQNRMLGQGVEDKDMVLGCYQSEDFREGLEAFLGKRKPDWQGR